MSKRGLGKGLKALIPEGPGARVTETVEEAKGTSPEQLTTLKVSEIKPSPHQPRTSFAAESIEELAQSIKAQGLIQPLVVRKAEQGYELIAGERRLRAIKLLGLSEVPVIVKEKSEEQDLLAMSLIENIQRENLNPVEEAQAYQQLIEKHELTQEALARSVGKDRSSVANTMRLLRLPQRAQQALIDGLITAGHAKALLSLDRPQEQIQLLELVIAKKLSVRAVEELTKKRVSPAKKKSSNQNTDPHHAHLEEELQRSLGTRVKVVQGRKRGRIVVEYYTPDDLDRILSVMGVEL